MPEPQAFLPISPASYASSMACALKGLASRTELAADIDIRGVRAHGGPGEEATLDQLVRARWRMISRSLQVPGSPSSALTTR